MLLLLVIPAGPRRSTSYELRRGSHMDRRRWDGEKTDDIVGLAILSLELNTADILKHRSAYGSTG